MSGSMIQNMNPAGVDCPVIGGDDGPTVVPLVSQCAPRWKKGELSVEDLRKLTEQIQVKQRFKRIPKNDELLRKFYYYEP